MDQPNVLLVVMDTARADTVSAGIAEGTLPTLARIAGEGTRFERAMTTGPWTLPSHASLFTGQYTSDHGTHAGAKRFAPENPPLSEHLREHGYTTAGISANPWISPEFGFDRGFEYYSMGWDRAWNETALTAIMHRETRREQLEEFVDRVGLFDAPGFITNVIRNRLSPDRSRDDGAERITSRSISWIEDREDDDPFFLFLNYVEPHLRYDPPPQYRDRFLPAGVDPEEAAQVNQDPWKYIAGNVEMDDRDFEVLKSLYEGELSYLDSQIARLYRSLAELGTLDETAIVVVGDHGENIGEHSLMDHQYCLYETLLHVPLLVRYPPRTDEVDAEDGLVEVRDLCPTILDLAGIEQSTDERVSDHDLLGATGNRTREHTIAEYATPQPSMAALERDVEYLPEQVRQQYNRALRSIRTSRWKYVESAKGSVELYDLDADPQERENVAGDHPAAADRLGDRLEGKLGEHRRAARGQTSISAANEQRLEDLGYL